jgi:hypothetical protein
LKLRPWIKIGGNAGIYPVNVNAFEAKKLDPPQKSPIISLILLLIRRMRLSEVSVVG